MNSTGIALERRARRRWVAIILGLLVSQIGLTAVGIGAALHNQPKVVENYYDKAVHWDELHGRTRSAAGTPTPEKKVGESVDQ